MGFFVFLFVICVLWMIVFVVMCEVLWSGRFE